MSDLSVFYVIDNSASINGESLDLLNNAFKDSRKSLIELAKANGDVNIKFAMMTFGNDCDWLTPHGPEQFRRINDFMPSNMVSNLGCAINELNTKLCDKLFFNLEDNYFKPIVIIMSDGLTTDEYEWAVENLKDSNWYDNLILITFALSDDSELEILSSITGNKSNLILDNNQDLFKKLVRFEPLKSSLAINLLETNTKTELVNISNSSFNSTTFDKNNLESVLAYIKEKYSLETFIDHRLYGYLSDFAPNLREENKCLRNLCQKGIIKEIIENKNSDEFKQFWLLHKVIYYTIDENIEIANILSSIFKYKVELDKYFFIKNKFDYNKEEISSFIDIIMKKYRNQKKYYDYYRLRRIQQEESRDSDILYQIGLELYEGRNINQDFVEALKYFELSAEQKHIESLLKLGEMYLNGIGTEQNNKEAFRYFKLSADLGDLVGINKVGVMYLDGIGTEQNYEEAFRFFKLSADRGDITGINNIGKMYYDGIGIEQNYKEAFRFFKLSADRGDIIGINNVGKMYYDGIGIGQNYEEAFKYFKHSADQGNAFGQVCVGKMYINNQGVEKNTEIGFKYIKQSADQGDSYGLYWLGIILLKDNIKLYKKIFSLSNEYYYRFDEWLPTENEDEKKERLKIAFKYIKQSADQGNLDAIHKVGEMYYDGIGIGQNYEEAFKYFKLSADQGNEKAIQFLQEKRKFKEEHPFLSTIFEPISNYL